jgi:uncharacterized protein (DUF1499 family)
MGRLWGVPSVLVVILLAAGVQGAYSGLLSPESGFRLFIAGVAFAGDDVTTDLEDPPALDVAAGPGAPRPDLRELQQMVYPEVRPLAASEPPPQTFQRALKVAREMPGWEVTRVDEARGVIEVVATSRIFRLPDDLVIRIRPDGEGSKLDLRSRSRIGRGYTGDPAARILSYQERFRAASQ